MSWAELSGRDIVQTQSPVETERLGLSTARVEIPQHGESGIGPVKEAIVGMDADLTVVRSPANRVLFQAQLTDALPQYLILHADTLAYWQLPVTPNRFGSDESPVEPGLDIELLESLVVDIFDGYQNHYSANPYLRSLDVGHAYAAWAVHHVAAGLPYCYLESGGHPAAIATLAVAPEHLEVLLAGVASAFRGRGVYRELLVAIEDQARLRQIESVVISTQVQNIAVQRSWARFGFVPLAAFDTLHVMKPDL